MAASLISKNNLSHTSFIDSQRAQADDSLEQTRNLSSLIDPCLSQETKVEHLIESWELVNIELWEHIKISKDVYCLDQESAEKLAGFTPLAAKAAELSYKLPEGVTEIEIAKERYGVSFLPRASGIGVATRPAIYLESKEKIIVSIPGTENLNDWFSNLKSEMTSLKDCALPKNPELLKKWIEEPVLVHTGFLEVALSLFSKLQLNLKSNQSKEVIFTGHSQGAAVSQLLAFLLTITKTVNNPYVITFASPRVFSKESFSIVAKTTPLSLTISHPADVIPKTPLGTQGFKHVGIKVSLSLSRLQKVISDNGSEDLAASTTGDLDAASRVILAARAVFSPTSIFHGIAEVHGIKYYSDICSPENCAVMSQIILGQQINLVSSKTTDQTIVHSPSFSVKFIRGECEEADRVKIFDARGNSLIN